MKYVFVILTLLMTNVFAADMTAYNAKRQAALNCIQSGRYYTCDTLVADFKREEARVNREVAAEEYAKRRAAEEKHFREKEAAKAKYISEHPERQPGYDEVTVQNLRREYPRIPTEIAVWVAANLQPGGLMCIKNLQDQGIAPDMVKEVMANQAERFDYQWSKYNSDRSLGKWW